MKDNYQRRESIGQTVTGKEKIEDAIIDWNENIAKLANINTWKVERKLINNYNRLYLKWTGLTNDEISDIIYGSEKSYPIKRRDAPNDGALRLSEFLDNEMSGYKAYFEDYVDKWLMYRDMFDIIKYRGHLRTLKNLMGGRGGFMRKLNLGCGKRLTQLNLQNSLYNSLNVCPYLINILLIKS